MSQCIARKGIQNTRCKLTARFLVGDSEVCFRHLPWMVELRAGQTGEVTVRMINA
jgi:hypothetical protein